MNKKISIIISLVLLLVAAVAGGMAFNEKAKGRKLALENAEQQKLIETLENQLANAVAKPVETGPVPVVLDVKEDDGRAAELEVMRNKLAEKDLAILNAQEALEKAKENRRANRGNRESMADRMARMKEEEPERYQEMVKRRSDFQQTIKTDMAKRSAVFLEADTSMMTEEQKDNHNQLVERMEDIWALMEKAESEEGMGGMREMFNAANEIRPLMEKEREVLFENMGRELGFEGEEIDSFQGYIDEIYSATTFQMPGRGNRGGGRGR